MSRKISEGWMSYLKVLPVSAPQIQIDETRMAFYAGVAVMFDILTELGNGADDNDEPEIAVLEGIKAELDEYGKSLQKGLKQ